MNRAIATVRGAVERAFGSMKKHYGLGRARYLGTAKVGMQFLLSAMAFNLSTDGRLPPWRAWPHSTKIAASFKAAAEFGEAAPQ